MSESEIPEEVYHGNIRAKRLRRNSKTIMALAVGFGLVMGLTSCNVSSMTPLPKEERYAPLNSLDQELGYQEQFSEATREYGGGDGVFGTSTLSVTIDDPAAYDIILENVDRLRTSECNFVRENSIQCYIEHFRVSMNRGAETNLTLTDARNGRD